MTTIDMTGASDAEFEARIAPFEAVEMDPLDNVAHALHDADVSHCYSPWAECPSRPKYRRLAAAAIAAMP